MDSELLGRAFSASTATKLGCPTLRGVRSVGTPAAFPPGLYPRCSAVTATALAFMLYVAHAQPAPSILWCGLLALHHDQLLPAMALLGSARNRDLFLRVGAGATTLSLRTCGICGDAGTCALADRRARARRPVAGDEGGQAGIRMNWRSGRRSVERGRIWQSRFYDFVVFSEHKRVEKLRYMHGNPVKRGLVLEPQEWAWSSFRHYAYDEPRSRRGERNAEGGVAGQENLVMPAAGMPTLRTPRSPRTKHQVHGRFPGRGPKYDLFPCAISRQN